MISFFSRNWLWKNRGPSSVACHYRGADKSLARPGRKQADVSVRMTWISFGTLPCRKKKLDSWRLNVVEIARVSNTLPSLFLSWSGQGLISTPVLDAVSSLSLPLRRNRLTEYLRSGRPPRLFGRAAMRRFAFSWTRCALLAWKFQGTAFCNTYFSGGYFPHVCYLLNSRGQQRLCLSTKYIIPTYLLPTDSTTFISWAVR